MAFVYHRATLDPEKPELLRAWVPGRRWAGQGPLTPLGAYRFDDPAGEVGLEAFLLGTDDDTVLHVPLTYRARPLEGAEQHLVGTTEHSELGTRYVYDGCADPVWASALARCALTGGTQAALEYEEDGRRQVREARTTVAGSGDPTGDTPDIVSVRAEDLDDVTVVHAGDLELVVVRRVGATIDADETVSGHWRGGTGVLAGVRRI
jgi:hypothetical protein